MAVPPRFTPASMGTAPIGDQDPGGRPDEAAYSEAGIVSEVDAGDVRKGNA